MRKEDGRWKLEVGRWAGKLAVACAVLASGPAWGQLLSQPPLIGAVSGGGGMAGAPETAPVPPWPARVPGKLTVSAAAQEKPALRWSLLPKLEETQKGNAAVRYMGSMTDCPRLTMEEYDLMDAAWSADLSKLDDTDPRLTKVLAEFGDLRLLREGARLDSADWESNLRQAGIMVRLPSLGALREQVNGLSLRVRLDIKHHDWAAAQDKLQTGYMVARHLNMGETLIETMVGTSIASRMNRCLEDWAGEPGSPNLYWPLANMPVPFSDWRRAMAFERAGAAFTLPELREMRAGHYSAEQWPSMIGRLAQFTQVAGVNNSELGWGEVHVPDWQQKSVGAMFGILLYPQAKAFLVERGFKSEAVEKMAVPEALGRYFVQSFDEEEDEMFKWMGLPTGECLAGLAEWQKQFDRERAENKGNILTNVLLPSLSNAILLSVRVDRQLAALRVVEAVRGYAAEKGQLPANLAALGLPLPTDPLGKGFDYERTEGGAVLSSPPQKSPRDTVRYEITLRK